MPPHKCAYFRCNNTSEQKSMFRFPANNANRLKMWLDNCGNLTLSHLPAERLRARYLCIEHFDKKFIKQQFGKKNLLKRDAIPKPYLAAEIEDHPRCSPLPSSPELKVLTPKRVYVNKRKLHDIPEEPGPIDSQIINTTPRKRNSIMTDADTPKCKKIKSLLKNCKKELSLQIKKNKRLCSKNRKSNKKNVDLSKHKFSSKSSKLITLMQLRKSKTQWNDEEKKFCMTLYYKSPAAYKFMIKSGIKLAAPSTIQRWLQDTNCLPGINDEVFDNIKIIFNDRPIKERACVICFDEMSIMTDLEYTNKYDMIEGFEDFGGGDRNEFEAKYALVFIARGIYMNWKIPLAYFLSSKNVDSGKLRMIVESVIKKLFESGLIPKATVCDQATTNVKMIKSLGADVDNPFFYVDGRKLFAIFDAPHLIKSIRNNLLQSDFELDGKEISFKDIISVYNIDKNNKSKSLKKLTPVHINPNSFQKMRVKLATQVLSNSVAAALKTAISSGELISDTAKNTADFIQLCNDLFDCLNSKNKFDCNPYRCAITNNQNSMVNKTLIKSKEIFRNLRKINYDKNNQRRLSRPPCFDGIIQTINAVLQLSAEEFSEGTGVKFLITYRLNQDVIENLFGIYRIKGGCNKNPTAKSLRSIFRSNLLNNLMKFDKTNCETDQDEFLTTHQNTLRNPLPSSSATSNSNINIHPTEHFSPTEQEINTTEASNAVLPSCSNETVSLETCSIVYFAGWLGKSCIDKFDCVDCKKILLNDQVDLTDQKQLLLINKTYSNITTPTLKSPSDFLLQLVNKMLIFYCENISKLHKLNLVTDLIIRFKNLIMFDGNYHDINHYDYLIKKLLEVKIYDYCKSRKKALQLKSKLRILQNQ